MSCRAVGTLPATTAPAGAKAKRMKMPNQVIQKDADGAMTIDEVSSLVRGLCRQHDLDRLGWQDLVEAAR